MGSQHPSPGLNTLCDFKPQIWPEIIRCRKYLFEGSRMSCDVIIFGFFFRQIVAGKNASCQSQKKTSLPIAASFGIFLFFHRKGAQRRLSSLALAQLKRCSRPVDFIAFHRCQRS